MDPNNNQNNPAQPQPGQNQQTANPTPVQPATGVVQPENPAPTVSPPQPIAPPMSNTPPATPAASQPVQPQQPASPAQPTPQSSPTAQPTSSVVTPGGGGGFFKKLIVFLSFLLIIGGISAGAYFYLSGNKTQESATELQQAKSESQVEPIVLELPTDGSSLPGETVSYSDEFFNFSFDYPPSWEFECLNCGQTADSTASSSILEAKTTNFELDENEKIVSGAWFSIKSIKADDNTQYIEDFIAQDNGYTDSIFNNIPGALNLDPSYPTQGFIYEDNQSGLLIQLEWRFVTESDPVYDQLEIILDSFKQVNPNNLEVSFDETDV